MHIVLRKALGSNIRRVANVTAWATGLGVTAVLLSIQQPSAVLAQVPWPTPPPAPAGPFPEVIPTARIKPVPAPPRPGSLALQIDPVFAGRIPRYPPRPSAAIVSGETDSQQRITLHIDAGALDRTLQLTYEPLPADQVPDPGPGHQIRRAFRVQTYDYTGAELAYSFMYPVRLTLRISEQELTAAGNDPARLLLARLDPQRSRWQPLVTTYRASDGTLLVRITQPGLYSLITNPAPIPR